MDKVYILTSRRYSDYYIVGVFERKEKAERYKKILKLDEGNIEEHKLGKVDLTQKGYVVYIDLNGNVIKKSIEEFIDGDTSFFYDMQKPERIIAQSTKSFRHAIKMARDKLAESY